MHNSRFPHNRKPPRPVYFLCPCKQERAKMPGKKKTAKAAAPKKDRKKVAAKSKSAAPKRAKAKIVKPKAKKLGKPAQPAGVKRPRKLISSEVVYHRPAVPRRSRQARSSPMANRESERDIIRHNGSVVILAMDSSKNKKRSLDRRRAPVPARRQPVFVGVAGRQARSRRRRP
jgi:hypothetical protein